MCTIVPKLFAEQVCGELLLMPPTAGFSPHVARRRTIRTAAAAVAAAAAEAMVVEGR